MSKLIIVLFFMISCNKEVKFEKGKWSEKMDAGFPSPYRSKMLFDLTKNHKLVGLTYLQLIKNLGFPDNKDSSTAVYNIIVDYGSDIDPVYTKNLEFAYSKDSLITSFRIVEWKK